MGIFNTTKVINQETKVVQHDKTVDDIFEAQVSKGLLEHCRPKFGVFTSSLSAGLELGFSVYCIALVASLFQGSVSPSVFLVLKSAAYSVGFIFVKLSRSELFTEQTAVSILPVLTKQKSMGSLFKLWGTILSGNLLGCLLFALIILTLNAHLWQLDTQIFSHLALGIISFPWKTILISSVIAGWLMALLSWMVASCGDTISKIMMVFLVTFLIALGHLHHCILGATEVLLGLFVSSDITFFDLLRFQFVATLGNILGGFIFIAVVKYYFIRFSDIKIPPLRSKT